MAEPVPVPRSPNPDPRDAEIARLKEVVVQLTHEREAERARADAAVKELEAARAKLPLFALGGVAAGGLAGYLFSRD